MKSPPKKRKTASRIELSRYEPLDFFVLRAPLLSVDFYRDLKPDLTGSLHQCALLASEGDIRRALAAGSATLLDALSHRDRNESRRQKVYSKLLRYLIRMSSRPTPFGLFAGVALGQWGDETDIQLSAMPRLQRTRPDMGWLMNVVTHLESVPALRRHLRFVANPSALIRAGRIFLAERVSRNEAHTPPAVSIRATEVARRTLLAARDPLPYDVLAAFLLASTPGATAEQVESLLTSLWEQTLLLTDLRPPLTGECPCRYVIGRLSEIPAAAEIRAQLEAVLEAATVWDAASQGASVDQYRAMVKQAAAISSFDRSPFQIDTVVGLAHPRISKLIADETARAAELLLRIGPLPRGPAYLTTYRRAFERRYGLHREVPLLELLDQNFGLGPPDRNSSQLPSTGNTEARNQVLVDLALSALRERKIKVDLNEDVVQRLETWQLRAEYLPPSLELFVSVAAASAKALNTGDFLVVMGPNVGSASAGRNLGRFADMLDGAHDAMRRAARREEAHAPKKIWAELAYQPRFFRLGNVSIRPNIRAHEIALGVSLGGEGACQVPLDELVVGIRGDRFYLRWPAADRDVVITAGHMLNHLRAPTVCRFLSELSHDGITQLVGFNWGSASTFPVLPRVQVGRIVLALAQWRLGRESAHRLSAHDANAFSEALIGWREDWQVPRHVYLCSGDNRLLIDLSAVAQSEQLRHAILGLREDGVVVLSEVLPGLDQAWVRDSNNQCFMTELVVPLALRLDESADARLAHGLGRRPDHAGTLFRCHAKVASTTTHVRTLGSDWLFAKLYCGRDLEDDLIAGHIRRLTERVLRAGMADTWFFLRYGDPERHVRIRFRGKPDHLLGELLPEICSWASELIETGLCQRFVLDTYDREIERFGGAAGTALAETVFAADSQLVINLMHLVQSKTTTLDRTALAVLSVDTLLESLGLDARARRDWCWTQVQSRREASREYRERGNELRPFVATPDRLRLEPGGSAVARNLDQLRTCVAEVTRQFIELETSGVLSRPLEDIVQSLIHLHLNRLLGADRSLERRILGLLWRLREGLLRAPL
jgi:thiopeptide-type bacteriocin biosynthesis protein